MWHVLGWIVVGLLTWSIIYGGCFHSRNYARMMSRTSEEDGWSSEFTARMARRYMWKTILMQIPKVVAINILRFLPMR